ncbi:glycoside hydrolase family 95 protein [Asticcacaulis sp.]|uniref:glycoside hydrolase family 95 protein n=1 Tax=Asticcacaulis sp. TaxID=1872648 RepID=UPI002C7264C1|nr:glycoside hydrolase family 95 protein [Asticcacaulis sp.]HTM82296.1 glycoside hydrolase family 95 protein [Asticcacaulis sp.]
MAYSNRPSRRVVLSGMTALSLAPALPAAAGGKSNPNRLWYRQPASRWEEALPIGNGRLGVMVFGRTGQERLQLNEDTLWSGGPYTPDSPEALAALPEVRRLIAEGRYKEATDLAGAKMMARPLSQMAYGTLGDLLLTFDDQAVPSPYERHLDLETAIAGVSYTTPSGTISREVFASAPDQVVVVRLEAKGRRLGFDLAYRGPQEVKYTAANFSGSATSLEPAAPDWAQREAVGTNGQDIRIRQDGPQAWLITGRNNSSQGIPAGLTFAMRVQVITDGQVSASDSHFSIKGARTATLLISAATSYVNFRDTSGEPIAIVRRQGEAAARKSYAQLRQAHIKDYMALFGSFTVDLGGGATDLPTDQRIVASENADDPALAALYLQYARYLLISSSRPGTQPANLQGIWNASTNPPWGSKYTININTEMNYWLAGPAGLSACVEPLLGMTEDLAVSGASTAKTMYNARGWVAHHNTDLWRAAAPIDGPLWGLWPCGGAWLCNTLWDQYDYSRDEAMLARLYPLLRGASLFFLDTLIEDPGGRGLITSPSVSPENSHPFGSSVCAGPAMDRQIIRDLFNHTIAAGKTLGRDSNLIAEITATVSRIAPDRIGKTGQLQEWLEDWDDAAPEPQHRHISHLYALFPSSQVNPRDTPDLVKAAKVTLERRGDLSTGWATAWRINCWARTGEGDHAHSILKSLLGPQRTYPNMFDAHPPFQIDGNFGGAMGIMEMIVQSWGEEIHLLPALPSAWPSGRMTGVRVRGNIAADISWTKGKLAQLRLKGRPGEEVRLRHGGELQVVRLNAGGVYEMKV